MGGGGSGPCGGGGVGGGGGCGCGGGGTRPAVRAGTIGRLGVRVGGEVTVQVEG